MLTAENKVETSSTLLERLWEARRRSDSLFEVVRGEALYERPIPERHRIIFYVGHLEAFDWNLLSSALGAKAASSGQAEFDRLFAFGIDPVGGGLPTDVPSDWPRLASVRDYVSKVRAAIDNALEIESRDSEAITRDGFGLSTLLNVAVEHRLMHVETLSYMLHQLPFAMKVPQADSPVLSSIVSGGAVVPNMIGIPAGAVRLGLARELPHNSESFGWDNEFETHTVEVPAFEIDQYKVTNREYMEFVEAGGYETRAFWLDDDWNWINASEISHPLFWKLEGGDWRWRGMFEELPLPPDWPVYVSHAEASAYARWAGKSLPTEAEWQRAAEGAYDAGARSGNFDFRRWDPVAANAYPEAQSAFGVRGMLGNGWEWTSSFFAPFPRFEPFPFYRGYSADFFDGKHFVMKGGSPRTAACMLRPTFRNWFQAHYQYVYAGFRCVRRG